MAAQLIGDNHAWVLFLCLNRADLDMRYIWDVLSSIFVYPRVPLFVCPTADGLMTSSQSLQQVNSVWQLWGVR